MIDSPAKLAREALGLAKAAKAGVGTGSGPEKPPATSPNYDDIRRPCDVLIPPAMRNASIGKPASAVSKITPEIIKRCIVHVEADTSLSSATRQQYLELLRKGIPPTDVLLAVSPHLVPSSISAAASDRLPPVLTQPPAAQPSKLTWLGILRNSLKNLAESLSAGMRTGVSRDKAEPSTSPKPAAPSSGSLLGNLSRFATPIYAGTGAFFSILGAATYFSMPLFGIVSVAMGISSFISARRAYKEDKGKITAADDLTAPHLEARKFFKFFLPAAVVGGAAFLASPALLAPLALQVAFGCAAYAGSKKFQQLLSKVFLGKSQDENDKKSYTTISRALTAGLIVGATPYIGGAAVAAYLLFRGVKAIWDSTRAPKADSNQAKVAALSQQLAQLQGELKQLMADLDAANQPKAEAEKPKVKEPVKPSHQPPAEPEAPVKAKGPSKEAKPPVVDDLKELAGVSEEELAKRRYEEFQKLSAEAAKEKAALRPKDEGTISIADVTGWIDWRTANATSHNPYADLSVTAPNVGRLGKDRLSLNWTTNPNSPK
jgi:outer membrane murein-binding lipoprotein Lpp